MILVKTLNKEDHVGDRCCFEDWQHKIAAFCATAKQDAAML
jgi:hypothetical protein